MKSIKVNDLDKIKILVEKYAIDAATPSDVYYADIRVEAGEGIGAFSEDGNPKITSKDSGLSLGVRVIAGKKIKAAGYCGKHLGVSDLENISVVLKETLEVATERARENSSLKSAFKKSAGALGKTIQSTELAFVKPYRATVEPEFEIDPRTVTKKQITDIARDAAMAAKNYHSFVKQVELIVNTMIVRQIFASSEGTLIDQSYCSTGGTIFVIAQNDKGDRPADLYHHTGNQLGFEALTKGKNAHEQTIEQFARGIARETVELANAKPAPLVDTPTTVVLDPDLVALFAHEIIGHPSELDRAIKMETGYAGRSWFLKNLKDNMIGKQVGSPLLTAFSDPTLKGAYGYYLYDDEGTKARRVYHIVNGIYQDFMNSRQTAAITGAKPNGHYKANDASVVPLIRMSASAIAPGKQNPKKIISEVEHGYYCVGHRTPSISESRENFHIAPRLIYEIKNGHVGQVFRDGRVTSDSKEFFMAIDAVGNDFKIFPIPNCGKGQPMQSKQVGNGGPTIRSKAKISRGT